MTTLIVHAGLSASEPEAPPAWGKTVIYAMIMMTNEMRDGESDALSNVVLRAPKRASKRQGTQHQQARTPSREGVQKFAIVGYSSSAAHSRRVASPAADAQFLEIHSGREHDNSRNTFSVPSAVLIQNSTLEVQILVL